MTLVLSFRERKRERKRVKKSEREGKREKERKTERRKRKEKKKGRTLVYNLCRHEKAMLPKTLRQHAAEEETIFKYLLRGATII